MTAAIDPDPSRCDTWRPEQVASLLEGVSVPWYVAEEKNAGDFVAALPRLGREQRRWLRGAFVLVHPGRGWLADLDGADP